MPQTIEKSYVINMVSTKYMQVYLKWYEARRASRSQPNRWHLTGLFSPSLPYLPINVKNLDPVVVAWMAQRSGAMVDTRSSLQAFWNTKRARIAHTHTPMHTNSPRASGYGSFCHGNTHRVSYALGPAFTPSQQSTDIVNAWYGYQRFDPRRACLAWATADHHLLIGLRPYMCFHMR